MLAVFNNSRFSNAECFLLEGEKMEQRIERIERKLIRKGAILDIYTDKMRLPNGKTEEWDIVEHRLGAAAVVPITDDGKILMVHQYRPAIGRVTLEIPAGSRDNKTEDTKICAARELEEETGYRSEHLSKLLSLKTTVAFCNESIDVYLAKNLIPSKQNLDEGEEIEVEAFTLEELLEMIYAGKLQDGKTVASILAYQNLKK